VLKELEKVLPLNGIEQQTSGFILFVYLMLLINSNNIRHDNNRNVFLKEMGIRIWIYDHDLDRLLGELEFINSTLGTINLKTVQQTSITLMNPRVNADHIITWSVSSL